MHSELDNKTVQKSPKIKSKVAEHYQTLLELKSIGLDNDFESDKWSFLGLNRGKYITDFSLIRALTSDTKQRLHLEVEDQQVALSPIVLAKVIFLEMTVKSQPTHMRNAVFFLKQFLSYWHSTNYQTIKPGKIKEMFQSLMMTELTPNGISMRLKPYAYGTLFNNAWMEKLRSLQTKMHLSVFQQASKKVWQRGLRDAVEACTGKSLADYAIGGSFDYLTLDIGKYYYDYNIRTFKQYHVVARSIQAVKADMALIADNVDLKCNQVFSSIINHLIDGKSIVNEHEFFSAWHSDRNKYNYHYRVETLRKMQHEVISRFKKYYEQYYKEDALFTTEAITSLANRLRLVPNDATHHFLLSLLLSNTCENGEKSTNRRVKDLSVSLHYVKSDKDKKNKGLKHLQLTPKVFKSAYKEVLKELVSKINVPVLDKKFYKSTGIELVNPVLQELRSKKPKGLSLNEQMVTRLQQMGITSYVAYVGWRESEYGFPYEWLLISENIDITDSPDNPIRFLVWGEVPKTNGETRLKREITAPAALFIHRLHKLTGECKNAPCLYPKYQSRVKVAEPKNHIQAALRINWTDFVYHYTPFIELRRLRVLGSKKETDVLSKTELTEFKSLSEKYTHSEHLKSTMDRVTAELPRINAVGYEYSAHVRIFCTLGPRIKAYLDGTLPPHMTTIWDKHLTPELKGELARMDSNSNISGDLKKSINLCITEGCVYPTPHAFRHIWAEAVYRRYEGDIGALIRENFKHIGNRFFMAYLRDKDAQIIELQAKTNAICSIVKKHITMHGKEGIIFGGKMNRYLNKVKKLTSITKAEDLDSAILEFVTEEIIDIKSNSWGYCLLKARNQHRANCAVDGIPQRHNAAPKFCIGCDNNLIEGGHIAGLMFAIENDLILVATPEVPYYFKRASIDTLNKVIKELKSIDKEAQSNDNQAYIEHLESVVTLGQEAA
jgi:hypothetical protein